MTLTVDSLADAMQHGVTAARYAQLLPAVNACLLECGCTTVERAAMWFGQVGEESGGLKWMEELASGAEYNGRVDLGNTQSGDGPRFKGRGPIQVTGRHNYTVLSQWAFDKGLVPTSTYFVDNPNQLSSDQYGFVGVTWYWTTQRPMNDAADARDIVRATKYVNGGTNGLADRTQRWQHALALGAAILPDADGVHDSTLDPVPGFSGDPYWLADVIRAEGCNVVEMDGWQNRGEGDQGVLWGMVFHHTGNVNETPEGIAFHPTLGLAAHILIRPDATVYVCGIGKANHAGRGSWDGIETDNANEVTIGVEVAILPVEGAPHRSGWPDGQYLATVKVFAAILRKLAQRSNRAISHKEWATLGPLGWRQGKWDPGAVDMDIFRGDVQARIDSKPMTTKGFLMALSDKQQQELYDKIMAYPGVPGIDGKWPSRSIYRDTNNGVDDTVGMLLNIDGSVHELTVENRALLGNPDAIARVKATAAGTSAGSKLSDGSPDQSAISRAKFVLSKIPGA